MMPAVDQPLSDQRPEGLNLEEEKGTKMFTRTRSMARTAPRRQSRAASGHMVASNVGTCGTLDIFYSIVHPAL
jgi:hypothetical protein